VILAFISAGKVLTQLCEYPVDDKPRLGSIPYSEFLARKGKPEIDCFCLLRGGGGAGILLVYLLVHTAHQA
jgi:hypothetical protein